MATNTKEWSLEDYFKVKEGVNYARLGEVFSKGTVFDEKGNRKEVEKKMSSKENTHVTLLGILDKAREDLDLVMLKQTICADAGSKTCRSCFEHWLGEDIRYIALPKDRDALKKWQTVYSTTPLKMAQALAKKTRAARIDKLDRELNQTQFIKKFYWDKEMVQSVCMFIMHELHPENVHFFVYTERGESDKSISTYTIRLTKNSRFLLVVVEQKHTKHFSTYVFDLENGRCDVLDPTFYHAERKKKEKEDQEASHGKVRINFGFKCVSTMERNQTLTKTLQIAYEILQMFALVPIDLISKPGGWKDYIDTTLEKEQIEIQGYCHHWLPFRVAVNREDPNINSGLFQTEKYTSGPVCIVKFIDALFRLRCGRNVKFNGIRSRQRIIDEKWNTLGTSAPFTIHCDNLGKTDESQDILWKKSWLPKNQNGKQLVTDMTCLKYVNETLLESWVGGECDKELGEGIDGENFEVVDFPRKIRASAPLTGIAAEVETNFRLYAFVAKKIQDQKGMPVKPEQNDTSESSSESSSSDGDSSSSDIDSDDGKALVELGNKKGDSSESPSSNDDAEDKKEKVVLGKRKKDDISESSSSDDDSSDAESSSSEGESADEKKLVDVGKQKSVVPRGKEPVEPVSENKISTSLGKEVSVLGFTPNPNRGVATLPRKSADDNSSEEEDIGAKKRRRISKIMDNKSSTFNEDIQTEGEMDKKRPPKKRPYVPPEPPLKARYPLRQTDVRTTMQTMSQKIQKKRVEKIPPSPGTQEEEGVVPKEKEELALFSKRRKKDILDNKDLTTHGMVPVPNGPLNLHQWKDMGKFVDDSFVSWGWFTKKEHEVWIAEQRVNKENAASEAFAAWYERLIKESKEERQHAVKMFENEFKFTHLAEVVALKYNDTRESYFAKMKVAVTKDTTPDSSEFTEDYREIEVPTHWVEGVYDQNLLEKIKHYWKKGYVQVPGGLDEAKFKIVDMTIARIKYFPEHTRKIKDCEQIMKLEEKLKQKRNPKQNPQSQSRMMREIERVDYTKEDREAIESVPMLEITVEARWKGMDANGTVVELKEDWVRETFSDNFADELKRNQKGYVEVPVGDYKESHLYRFPHLMLQDAPGIVYQQKGGMNLCIPNALASVLAVLGFETEARIIHEYGVKILLSGDGINVLKLIQEKAREVLPNWLEFRKYTHHRAQKGKKVELIDNERSIFLGVMAASDGHRTHAVAVHGGFVYDANESIAIPFTQEGLDYCTSTPSRKSNFLHFHRGFQINYLGKAVPRIKRMTRPVNVDQIIM